MKVLIEIELEVEWLSRALFNATIDYRHPTRCGLCKHQFEQGESVSVIRDKYIPNLIICDSCAELIEDQMETDDGNDV